MKRRRWRSIAFLAALLGIWAVVEASGLTAPTLHTGTARDVVVVDGDTLRIGGGDIRLDGIDAPELRQSCTDAGGSEWPCGRAAREALAALVANHSITCEELARDRFDRAVAQCRNDTGIDLAAAIAEQGFAVATDRDDGGPYASEIEGARATKRGIWAGRFEAPADWRARHPRPLAGG